MGFNVFPAAACEFPSSRLAKVVAKQTARSQKLVAGNGMHLVTQAAWMFYILANCVSIPNVRVPRGVGAPTNDEDEENISTGSEYGDLD